jgi:hypothetical protein
VWLGSRGERRHRRGSDKPLCDMGGSDPLSWLRMCPRKGSRRWMVLLYCKAIFLGWCGGIRSKTVALVLSGQACVVDTRHRAMGRKVGLMLL